MATRREGVGDVLLLAAARLKQVRRRMGRGGVARSLSESGRGGSF